MNFEGAGAGACNVYYIRYENVGGLAAGGNVNNLSGCFDLSNRITVTRVVNCGDPCANSGGDSDGDGICDDQDNCCLLYTSPSPRDATLSRMPSSA